MILSAMLLQVPVDGRAAERDRYLARASLSLAFVGRSWPDSADKSQREESLEPGDLEGTETRRVSDAGDAALCMWCWTTHS